MRSHGRERARRRGPVTVVAPQGRRVTLVVADGEGAAGTVEPFEVDTPWWQDVAPIMRRHPGLVVLRLLEVSPGPSGASGGSVTYLVEGDPGCELSPWSGDRDLLADHPLRMAWARPGGPGRDLAWAASHVELTGPPRQERTWNLSCIWVLPTTRGAVWLKCVPPFFGHEGAVLDLLADQPVPRVLASDGMRVLMEELPGRDGYDASLREQVALLDALVALQSATVPRLAALRSAGVPDWTWPSVLHRVAEVVGRRAPDDARLAALLTSLPERIEAIERCELPTVLVHGDAHGGNARVGATPGAWFDWGDCRVGDAVLDFGVLLRPGLDPSGQLLARWASAWQRAAPGCQPHRAFEAAKPLLALADAVVYQGFLDAIEPTERVYHDRDVPHALARAAELAATPWPG